MPRRMIAVTVGILFIVQMVTAMIATSLIQGFVDGNPQTRTTDSWRPADDVFPASQSWVSGS